MITTKTSNDGMWYDFGVQGHADSIGKGLQMKFAMALYAWGRAMMILQV